MATPRLPLLTRAAPLADQPLRRVAQLRREPGREAAAGGGERQPGGEAIARRARACPEAAVQLHRPVAEREEGVVVGEAWCAVR